MMSYSTPICVSFSWTGLLVGCLLVGCGQAREASRVTVTQIEALEAFDALLPVGPDSVLQLYRRYDPASFHTRYQQRLEDASRLIDSLNALLDANSRIDTLAIDHTFENFGEAACTGHTIHLSSSYFFLYGDPSIIRSVISHEFGHKIYQRLPEIQRLGFDELWAQLGNAALLYLFKDGEYSGNAKFGGHPYESPTELFASAFNLLINREREFASRLQYVNADHLPLIERVKRNIFDVMRKK
jgi:hypothetical protein